MHRFIGLLLFCFSLFAVEGSNSETLTEKEILVINSFKDTGFASLSNDFTILNILLSKDFHASDASIHYNMYEICLANDDLNCSSKHLNRAIKLNPEDQYYSLSDSLTAYREVLERARNSAEKQNYNLAISDYDDIIYRFPDRALPYYEKGVILKETKDFDKAIVSFQKARELNPNKESYLNGIREIAQRKEKQASQYAKNKDFTNAIPMYEEAISYYPEFIQAYFNLAKSFYFLRDYESAKNTLLSSLKIDPSQSQSLKMLGDIYKKERNYEESINSYKKAIRVAPKYHKAHYSLAVVLDISGDPENAKKSLEETLKIEPSYFKAHETLGIINMKLGDNDSAIENFLNTISISKKSYKANYLLAEIHISKEDYSTAKSYAKDALDIKKNCAPAFYYLGLAEKNLGNIAAAKDAFESAKRDRDWRASANYELELIEEGE